MSLRQSITAPSDCLGSGLKVKEYQNVANQSKLSHYRFIKHSEFYDNGYKD